MNAVLIPVFRRPELLHHCLANIRKATNADKYHYIFRLDVGYDPDNKPMIEDFPFSKEVTFVPKTRYSSGKQSYAVLSGLQIAAKRTDKMVFLIEDDVIIAEDFFLWHEAVHQAHDLFSSHANLNVNSAPIKGDWDQYYLTSGDYGSIGTCLSLKALALIDHHSQTDYFQSPDRYIRNKFPASKWGTEQDGLIRRIQKDSGLPQAYPCHMELDGWTYGPRCYHAGAWGKNRPTQSISGTLSQRIDYAQRIIYDPQNMHLACGEGYSYDSIPVALSLPPWQHLTNVSKS